MADLTKWWEDPIFQPFFQDIKKSAPQTTEYTGAGDNGIVEPQKPIDAIQTNNGLRMIHEGELKVVGPDGKFAILPANMVGQDALSQLEKQSKVPGFASGILAGIPQAAALDAFNAAAGKNNTSPIPAGTSSVSPLSMLSPVSSVVGAASNVAGQVARPPVIAPIPTITKPAQIKTPDAIVQDQNYVIPTLSPTNQPAATETKTPVPTTPSDQDISAGIIRNYATGEGPYLQNIANRALQDQGAAGAAGTAALRQELTMAGATPEALQTAEAVRARDVGSESSKLQGTLAGQAMSEQLDAAQTLNTISANKENTDFNRQILAATTAFSSGDVEGGARIFNSLYPDAKIDFSKLATSANQADFTDGMSTITQYSTTGMTMDQLDPIFQRLGIYDKTGLTKDQVKGVLEDARMQSNPITRQIMTMSDDAIRYAFPEANSADYSKIRSGIAKFTLLGGVSFDKDGKPTMNTDLLSSMPELASLFGINIAGTTNYASYKSAAEAAGVTPISEATWIAQGKPAFSGTAQLGNKDDPDTIVTALAQKGITVTSDVAQSFIDEMGHAPQSLQEFTDWQSGKGDSATWNSIASKSPDNMIITNASGSPVLNQNELKAIVSAKISGDKRADAFYVDDAYQKALNEHNGQYLYSADQASNRNVGKIFTGLKGGNLIFTSIPGQVWDVDQNKFRYYNAVTGDLYDNVADYENAVTFPSRENVNRALTIPGR
jgi:hypothetical protein